MVLIRLNNVEGGSLGMGHSKELLNKIAEDVKKKYPGKNGYYYVFEESLENVRPRIEPDIKVYSKNGKLVCIVEIGYTRPEKLVKYVGLGCKDVRWYSKKGRMLPLSPKGLKIKTKVIREFFEYIPLKEERFLALPIEAGNVICRCCEIDEETFEDEESLEDYFLTYGIFYSNGWRGIMVMDCDMCGECFFISEEDMCYEITQHSIHSYDEFLHHRSKTLRLLKKADWRDRMCYGLLGKVDYHFEEMRLHIKNVWGFDIHYDQLAEIKWH